jgi:CRISPR-associated protein Csx14
VKTALIAPVGTSAPVVTEMVMYLNGLEGHYLTDVVILPTRDEYVRAHAVLAKEAIRHRYPRIRVHTQQLPFRDIKSTEDTIEFMRRAAKIIKEEREVHRCEKVYLSIAGGRKDVCTSLAIVGQLVGVDGVFHVINPDVVSFNISLERIKDRILELYRTPPEQRGEVYTAHAELFNEVMFPRMESLKYVQIPCIPYPREYLGRVVTLLLSSFTPIEKVGIPMGELERLKRAGIIKILKDRVVPTEFGEMLGKVWR